MPVLAKLGSTPDVGDDQDGAVHFQEGQDRGTEERVDGHAEAAVTFVCVGKEART